MTRNSLFKNDLKVLSTEMKKKIDRDANKGNWDTVSCFKLLEMLKDEVKELQHALESEPLENAIKECGDVGNFAMMIAGNLDRIIKKEQTNG